MAKGALTGTTRELPGSQDQKRKASGPQTSVDKEAENVSYDKAPHATHTGKGNRFTESGDKYCHVVFKTEDDTFWCIAHREATRRFKTGDRSLPLVDVVEAIDVFHGTHQREPERPPNGLLRSTFGTTSVDDIVERILMEGTIE